MYSLKTLQDQVLYGIINPEESSVLSHLKASNIPPKDRFQIYRNGVLENLRNTLKSTFPGIWKLIGEQCADGVAYSFSNEIKHLPFNGCLDDWGEEFPVFLQNFPTLRDLVYLKDYAELEWYRHLSYTAIDEGFLAPSELAQISEDLVGDLRFLFHPSVFFLKSKFPLDKIQAIVDDPNVPEISLNEGGAFAIIARGSDYLVKVLWVSEVYFNFLLSLKEGAALADSIAAIACDIDLELPKILSFMLSTQLVSEVLPLPK